MFHRPDFVWVVISSSCYQIHSDLESCTTFTSNTTHLWLPSAYSSWLRISSGIFSWIINLRPSLTVHLLHWPQIWLYWSFSAHLWIIWILFFPGRHEINQNHCQVVQGLHDPMKTLLLHLRGLVSSSLSKQDLWWTLSQKQNSSKFEQHFHRCWPRNWFFLVLIFHPQEQDIRARNHRFYPMSKPRTVSWSCNSSHSYGTPSRNAYGRHRL